MKNFIRCFALCMALVSGSALAADDSACSAANQRALQQLLMTEPSDDVIAPAKATLVERCKLLNSAMNGESFGTEVDTTNSAAPELTHLDVSPRSVDTTSGEQIATVTVRVKSAVGMQNGLLDMVAPEGYAANFDKQVFVCVTCHDGYEPRWRQIGETDEYELVADFVFDFNSPAGNWSVFFDFLRDNNDQPLPKYTPEQLEALGYNPYLEVMNPREIDTTPPVLQQLSLSSYALNTQTEAQQLTVSLIAYDDGLMGNHFIELKGPGDTYQSRQNIFVCNTCTDSNAIRWQALGNGLHQLDVTLELPRNSEPGIWAISLEYLRDALGNPVRLRPTDLAKLGFNSQFLVNTELEVEAGLVTQEMLAFVQQGGSGELSYTLRAAEGTVLPSEFDFKITGSYSVSITSGVNVHGSSYSKACNGNSLSWNCSLAIPDGLIEVSLSTTVTASSEGIFPVSIEMSTEGDANLANNYLTFDVDTRPQSYLISTEVLGGGGEFNPSYIDAPREQPAELELIQYAGYELLGVSGCDGALVDGVYITAPVVAECTVTAEFERLSYTVEFLGFSGELLERQTVLHGDAAVAPMPLSVDGYTFVGWDVEFNTVTSNLTVQAQYELTEYQVVVTVRGSGIASPLVSSAHWGDVIDVTLLPNEGSRLVRVSGCGGELVEPLLYRTAAITESCDIVVSYAGPRRKGILLKLINEL